MSIIGCEEGCTSHSDEVHDAIRTLHAYRPGQNHWTSPGWAPQSAWTLVPAMSPGASNFSWPVPGPAQPLIPVPAAQAMQNSELLSICEPDQALSAHSRQFEDSRG